MFLFEIANFKINQIMIFLTLRVPMSKFGAKVELRCNNGMHPNIIQAKIVEDALVWVTFHRVILLPIHLLEPLESLSEVDI